ncbi:hypothetical protein D3C81_1861810 [compost metagenome]
MVSLVHQNSNNAKLGTDISREFLRLHRQLFYLICHYRKPSSMLSSMCCFDRSVHCQHTTLIRQLSNLCNQRCNLFGPNLQI